MIPNGKKMEWEGHKLVFESEQDNCRGCFFEDMDSCPECDEGLWVEEKPSPWHAGTPTEEGWYLIKYKVGKNGERTCYRTEEYKLTPYCTFKNMEWQKIADEEEE